MSKPNYNILNLIIKKIISNRKPNYKNISDCEYIFIDTNKPLSLIELPELPEIKNIEKFSNQNNYFEEIIDSRLRTINHTDLRLDYSYLNCDYCRTDIIDQKFPKYYYCIQCNLNMCNLCYSEINEEIAIKNGAQNYHLRKDKLNHCQQNHKLVKKRIFYESLFSKFNSEDDPYDCNYCNICKIDIQDNFRFYNKKTEVDCCLKCFNTLEGKNFVIENNLKLCKNNFDVPYNYTFFGSLYDWYPIYTELDDEAMILFNYNKYSDYCGRFATCVYDSHGRCGYYTLPIEYNLKKIKEVIESYGKDNEKNEDENNYDAKYPIQKLMESLGFETDFG